MIEDDFYCTLKLKSGEEIFAKVAASDEDDRTMLLISNPIIVSEVKGKMGTMGYRVEPWLKTTTDDMFIINMTDVLTMSESSDIEMIVMYQNYIRQSQKEGPDNNSKINRRMGYLGNTRDVKEILEKIFKSS
jgi:5-deoxy-D-glucuronate isomerase